MKYTEEILEIFDSLEERVSALEEKVSPEYEVETEPEPKFSVGDSVFGVKNGVSYLIVSVDRYSREYEQFFYNVRDDDGICPYSVRESNLKYPEEILEILKQLKKILLLLNNE